MEEDVFFEWEQSLKWSIRMYADVNRAEAAIRVALSRYQNQSEECHQDLFSICGDLVRKSLSSDYALDGKLSDARNEAEQVLPSAGLIDLENCDLLYVFGVIPNKIHSAAKDLKFVSFATAQSLARLVGISSKIEWDKLYDSGVIPEILPPNPARTYKKTWRGWRAFLGIHHHKWRCFTEARNYCINFLVPQGINTLGKYLEYGRAGLLPEDIPLSPDTVFKSEWRNWKYWFGDEGAYHLKRPIYSYEEAREYVQCFMVPLGIDSLYKYLKYVSPPECLPRDLANYYKNRGWVNSSIFFGTNKVRVGTVKKCQSYAVIRAWCRTHLSPLGIKGKKQFIAYMKGQYEGAPVWPSDFPQKPEGYFSRRKEWVGYSDMLGNPNIRRKALVGFSPYSQETVEMGLAQRQEMVGYDGVPCQFEIMKGDNCETQQLVINIH